MSVHPTLPPFEFQLEYPHSLGVYDDYARARQVVDYLSDRDFAVPNIEINGTAAMAQL